MGSRKIISFDWAIKNVLRDKANFGILEGFLEALLKQKIKIESLAESESNRNHEFMKYNRVDLLAIDESGDHIIVEVQYSPEQRLFKRLLYGTSKDIIDNISTGEDYSNVKKVYSVSLVYFNVETPDAAPVDYVYHGKTEFFGFHSGKKANINTKFLEGYDKNSKEDVNVFPEYFIISLDIFDDNVKDALDEWSYSFKHHEVKDSFKASGIKEMSEKLSYVKMKPEEQRIYDKYLADLASDRGTLQYKYEEGLEKGLEKGLERGMEKGIKKGELKVAQAMLNSGISIEQVAEITKLDIGDLETLL